MSSLSESLLKGAIIDKQGAFTVDVDKARSKLERFRLENPLLYTVELVQAAVLSGATKVNIEVDANDFTLTFEAKRSLGRADLDDLESAILVRSKTTHPARLQLALAVSAAHALNPAQITIAGDGVILTIVGEKSTLADGPASRTVTVTLRETFRVGHVVDFFRGLVGRTAEERLLRDRCRYARTEIVVNGKAINGAALPGASHVDVMGRSSNGSVGFLDDPLAPSRLVLLRAGVIQEDLLWSEAAEPPPPAGMFAVIDADDLERDASFSRFVRDEAFKRVLADLKPSIEKCIGLLEAGVAGDNSADLRRARQMAVWCGNAIFRGGRRFAPVADAPLFRDPLGRRLTLRAVNASLATNKHVRIRTVADAIDAELLGEDVVVQIHEQDDNDLIRAMGWTTSNATPELNHRLERRQRRKDFLSRPAIADLPRDCVRQLKLSAPNCEISMGLSPGSSKDLTVHLVFDGCLLTTFRMPFPIPGLVVIMDGSFTPNDTYDDVAKNEFFSDMLLRVIASVPLLLDGPYQPGEAASAAFQRALPPLLGLAIDGAILWRIVAEARGVSPRRTLPQLELSGPKAHGIVEAPIIPMFPHGMTSIMALRNSTLPLGFVPPQTPTFRPSMTDVVVAGDVMMAVLKRALPKRRLVDLSDQAEQVVRQRRILQRPPTTRALAGIVTTVSIDDVVDHEGEQVRRVGMVGFDPRQTAPSTRLRVLFRGRLLQESTIAGPLPGLAASFDDETLMLSADGRATDLQPLAQRALAAVPALIARLSAARDPALWRLAQEVAALVFPTRQGAKTWRRVAQAGAKAGGLWRAMLEYSERIALDELEEAFKILCSSRTRPSLEALSALTTPTSAATGRTALIAPLLETSSVVDALLRSFNLGGIELARLEGGSITLAEIVAKQGPGKTGHLRTCTRPGTMPEGFADVVIVTELQLPLLQQLGLAMDDVDEDLSAARARLAFEAKETKASTLAADLTCVIRTQVDETGFRGECALLTGPPTTSPTAMVEVLHQGRQLVTLNLGADLHISMAAVLEVEDITPNAMFTDIVVDKRRDAFIKRVGQVITAMVMRLVDDAAFTDDGRYRLLEFVGQPRKGAADGRLAKRILALPLYRTVGGEPLALDACSKQSPLLTLRESIEGDAPTLSKAVVIADAAERYVLDRITTTRPVDTAWRIEVEAARRRGMLGPLPELPPTLLQRTARLGDITVTVGIPARFDTSTLWTGDEGLLVEAMPWPGPLPVVGIVEGPSAIRSDWSGHKVTDKLLASIQREVATLWLSALARLEAGGGTKEQPIEGLRTAAAELTLAIAGRAPTGWGPETVSVKARLRRAPVLSLAMGGHVSVEDAIALQPPELIGPLLRAGLLSDAMLRASVAFRVDTDGDIEPFEADDLDAGPDGANSGPPSATQASPPPPPPPPPPPAEVLGDRLIAELRLVRRATPHLVSDTELERIHVITGGRRGALTVIEDGRVLVHMDHPLSQAALTSSAALLVLVAATLSSLNAALDSVSDDEEQALLVSMARYAQTLDAPR